MPERTTGSLGPVLEPNAEAWRAALDRVGDESLPKPGLTDYAVDVAHRAASSITDWLGANLSPTFPFEEVVLGIAWVIVAVSASVVAVALARVLLRRRRCSVASIDLVDAEPAEGVVRRPGFWRDAVRARLAAGDLRETLEAIWWWVVERTGTRPDPALTTSDVLASKPSLRESLFRLDAWRYGPSLPTPESLVGLVDRLEGELG